VWYIVVFHEFWNCPENVSNKKTTKYHTVRTDPTSMKNNKIPHCQNRSNIHEKKHNITLSGQFK
jgi:hypothetical protein